MSRSSATVHHGSVLAADTFTINTLHFYSSFVVWDVRVVGLVVRIIDIFIVFLLFNFAIALFLACAVFYSLVDQGVG